MDETNDKQSEETTSVKEEEGFLDENGEPYCKVPKLENGVNSSSIKVKLNNHLTKSDYIETLRKHWAEANDLNDEEFGTTLYNEPFKLCVLQDFLSDKNVIEEIIEEMFELNWSRKQMDLYEFHQSKDISNITNGHLKDFFDCLQNTVMPWMQDLCGVELSRVSATCSMYNCGDYLLVHDDLLHDRQIAFVFYMSPWKNKETWDTNMGGGLEILSTDENNLPYFPIARKIPPRNNQFVFFKVNSRSFHQVGEITNFDYPRLTINGWFHGEKNIDLTNSSMRRFIAKIYRAPVDCSMNLSNWINDVYLKDSTKQYIQRHIEDNSEMCLGDFLKQSILDELTKELLTNATFKWNLKGPANIQHYESLDLESTSGLVKEFITLFSSKDMFHLLHEYTDLDLSGPNVKEPVFVTEIQRWSHGSYTILCDGTACERSTLDVILYLNASCNAGIITYLTPDSESTEYSKDDDDDGDSDLDSLMLTPKENSLNIVYLSEGTSRFTKYVSKKCKILNGYSFLFVNSYKE